MLFRIDISFSKSFLAVEIDEKGHTDRDIIFEEKKQKVLEKRFRCKFIRINTSNAKNGYNLDYEVGNVQAFIDEFKNKKIKKLEKKSVEEKELEEKSEKEMREKLEKEMREKLEKEMREKLEKELKEILEKELKDKNKELKKKIKKI